jgi:hypothetical protein
MNTHKHLYLIASIIILAATLMPQSTIVSAPKTPAIGGGSFIEHTIDSNFDGAHFVYATDMDGDGDVDVIGAACQDDDISWWENDGDENFTEHMIEDNFEFARAVYATDLDGDGDVDVLGAATRDDEIAWWENNGSESFTKHTIEDYFDGVQSVYATDIDEDGDMDVLGAAVGADDITWWENNGSGSFTKHTIEGDLDGAHSAYATDVDGDGDVDVVAAANGTTWWENDGSEDFTGHIVDSTFDSGYVYPADVDSDGDVDILGVSFKADEIAWWENDGSENFTKHTVDDAFDGPVFVHAADVDGDSDVDILGTAYTGDEIAWWENNGSESFSKHMLDGDYDGAYSVYTTDVDGDGDVDILGAASNAEEITWWEQAAPLELVFLPLVLKDPGPPTSVPVLDPIDNPNGEYDYTVTWSSVDKASEYTLQEDDNADFSTPITAYQGAGTSAAISDQDLGTYYYRVKASNSSGESGWSNVESTTVTEEQPSLSITLETCPDGVVVRYYYAMGDLVGYDAYVCVSATGSGLVDITAEMLNEDNEGEDIHNDIFYVTNGNDYKLTIAGDCQEDPWGSGEDFDLHVTSPSATSSKTITLRGLNDVNPPDINSMSMD